MSETQSPGGIWNGASRMDDITDDLPLLLTVSLMAEHWLWFDSMLRVCLSIAKELLVLETFSGFDQTTGGYKKDVFFFWLIYGKQWHREVGVACPECLGFPKEQFWLIFEAWTGKVNNDLYKDSHTQITFIYVVWMEDMSCVSHKQPTAWPLSKFWDKR